MLRLLSNLRLSRSATLAFLKDVTSLMWLIGFIYHEFKFNRRCCFVELSDMDLDYCFDVDQVIH